MKVAKISIRNILGLESMEIQPGAVTTITGQNGSGKTSVLEAVKTVLTGGHDATLIRKGQDAGEVVLVLDDGTELRKRVGQSGSRLSAKGADGKPLREPKALVEKLVDSLSANPVAFLTAPPATRAQYLLEAMPIEVDDARLAEAVGLAESTDTSAVGQQGLDRIEAIRKRLYDERTGVNRAAKELRAAAGALTSQLPPGDHQEIRQSLTVRRQELSQVQAEQAAAHAKAQAALAEKRQELSGDFDAAREELRSRLLPQIREAEEALNRLRAELKQGEDDLSRMAKDQLAELEREQRQVLHEQQQLLSETAGRLQAEVARLEQMDREHIRASETAVLVKQQQDDAARKEGEAEQLTAKLEALEEYRQSLLQALPIPGLEVRDGDIYVDGIQFDRVNTAKQVQIALKLALLRAGEVGLIIVDGLEALDQKRFEAFEKGAAKLGKQFIVTRVSEGPLTVNTIEAAE